MKESVAIVLGLLRYAARFCRYGPPADTGHLLIKEAQENTCGICVFQNTCNAAKLELLRLFTNTLAGVVGGYNVLPTNQCCLFF